jgi:1-aminocyclopropane-1-carboxylate deaminase/D-cysteine desulfhydrase-like pyridoxal-dependent ACC family enzyme
MASIFFMSDRVSFGRALSFGRYEDAMEPRAGADAKTALARGTFPGRFAGKSGSIALAPLSFGTYPTPVQELTQASRGRCALWVKRDDLTGVLYGGNKVRKLEYLVADARARGATRLVTIGAVGSHHVLATTLYGRREGFAVEAALVPQPRTEHVVEVVRAGIGAGLVPMAAGGYAGVVLRVVPRIVERDAYFVMVGGSSVVGSLGYVDAARELAAQIRAGEVPEPDVIVVALGSGGTVAGIAAGLEPEGIRSLVVGVVVAEPTWFVALRARRLARACLRATGTRAPRGWLDRRLAIDRRWLGAGYGHPTDAGARATEDARRAGLELDPTYTAKTFAAALERVESLRDSPTPKTVLYWHTLSSAPIAPLLVGAPAATELDPAVARLFA